MAFCACVCVFLLLEWVWHWSMKENGTIGDGWRWIMVFKIIEVTMSRYSSNTCHIFSISTPLKHEFRALCVTHEVCRSDSLPASRLPMGRDKPPKYNTTVRHKAAHSSTLPHSKTPLAEEGWAAERAIGKGQGSFSTRTFSCLLAKIKCAICSYQFNGMWIICPLWY